LIKELITTPASEIVPIVEEWFKRYVTEYGMSNHLTKEALKYMREVDSYRHYQEKQCFSNIGQRILETGAYSTDQHDEYFAQVTNYRVLVLNFDKIPGPAKDERK